MQKNLLYLIVVLLISSCNSANTKLSQTSPDQKLKVEFFTVAGNMPAYRLSFNQKVVLDTSLLGFEFQGRDKFQNDMMVLDNEKSSFSEKWELPWGEQRVVENNYNQLKIKLKQKSTGLLCNLIFKVYNDGLGFRYEFPEQKGTSELIISDELTQFKLTGDHTCWWLPGDWDIYEHLYRTTKFTGIDATKERIKVSTLKEGGLEKPLKGAKS